MLFLGLILSCTLKNIISKEKGRRKDISDAISKIGDAGVSVLKEVRQIDALKERIGDSVKRDVPKQKVVQRYDSNADPNIDIVS